LRERQRGGKRSAERISRWPGNYGIFQPEREAVRRGKKGTLLGRMAFQKKVRMDSSWSKGKKG